MTIALPTIYPADCDPDQGAAFANEALKTMRGNQARAAGRILHLYSLGRRDEALETLMPCLRYNPSSLATEALRRLYGRWVHAFLPEALEPLLVDWLPHTRATSGTSDIDRARFRAHELIRAIMNRAEALTSGQSKNPYGDWLYIMRGIGDIGTDALPNHLWPRAIDLAFHIARTRLRNPNLAPKPCHGFRRQPIGCTPVHL